MKKNSDMEYLEGLVAEGEHDHQDFKFEISDVRKIARSLSAFSNTKGGRLLVGVKDNGKIAGVRSEEEIYMVQAAASRYCQPKVELKTRSYDVNGKIVVEVDIAEAATKPVFALDENDKPWAYIRIHDENIQATIVHLKYWQHNKAPEGSLVTFTKREERLINILKEKGRVTLNQCCKLCRLNRFAASDLLADFIRFDIVTPVYENHTFYYIWNNLIP